MIAVANALGYGNCRDASDIDLLIVTVPRRVWTVRLFVVGLLRLFRQRPGEHARDAICPSFFVTTEAMDLESLQLPSPSSSRAGEASPGVSHDVPPDPYLLHWLTQLTVLLDRSGTYAAFWRANERWIRRWLPNAQPRGVHPRLAVFYQCRCERSEAIPDKDEIATGRLPSALAMTKWRGRLGDVLERWARRFQERRFPSTIRELANRDSRVVISESMLKFHTDDRRAEYRQRWMDRLQA